MTVRKVTDLSEITGLIDSHKNRNTESNFFLLPDDVTKLIDKGSLYILSEAGNAYILEDKGNCYRLHYFLNDLTASCNLTADKPVAIEILFRGNEAPKEICEFWERNGFATNLLRRNLSAKFADIQKDATGKGITIKPAIHSAEAEFARSLFNSVFDPYTGDYVSESEAVDLISERHLLVAYKEGNPVGALHFYVDGRTAWIGHIAVEAEARGNKIGQQLVAEFIRQNHKDEKSRYALWVQAQNVAANKMYENFGFRYAGKSSLSIIKKNYK